MPRVLHCAPWLFVALATSSLGFVACRTHAPAPAAPPQPAIASPRVVVITSAPLPTTVVPAAPFPAAPQVSGHGVGGTCEAACRVEQQSYLRTVCGNEHGGNAGAFREMDRDCRNDAARDYRDCVSRCRR